MSFMFQLSTSKYNLNINKRCSLCRFLKNSSKSALCHLKLETRNIKGHLQFHSSISLKQKWWFSSVLYFIIRQMLGWKESRALKISSVISRIPIWQYPWLISEEMKMQSFCPSVPSFLHKQRIPKIQTFNSFQQVLRLCINMCAYNFFP